MIKILIADDEPVTRRLLAQAVESEGHVAIECSDGARALATLKDNPGIRLLITDVSMPDMRGDELTEVLKEDERFESLPIIVCSGTIQAIDVVDLLGHGAVCLPKPVDRDALIAAMRQALATGEDLAA